MVWDIFDEMRRMQEEMDRMFSDFYTRPYYQLGPGRALQKVDEGVPYRKALVDVQETDKEVVITAELPGMDKKNIELNVTADRVEIKAQKREETIKEKEGFKAYGRQYAGFYRSVLLPAAVESDNAKATYKNGILEVLLPKRKVAVSHSITIE